MPHTLTQGHRAIFTGTVRHAEVCTGTGPDGARTVPTLRITVEAPSVIHPTVVAHVPFDTHRAAELAAARYTRGTAVQFEADLRAWQLTVPHAAGLQALTQAEAARAAPRVEDDLFATA